MPLSWATIRRDSYRGAPVIVKTTTYDARVEADGLRALAAAGAPVPDVVSVDRRRIVLDEVSGQPDWPGLGRTVAQVHRRSSPRFGWHSDNVLGGAVQHNTWTDVWHDFYIGQRILPWLHALPPDLARRMERACEGPLADLLDHDAEPSLIHGDLWSGNVVDGRWLIDPAVSFSDREIELAFAAVFGGIPASFFEAYEECWPMDEGWQRRRPALQLYHLIVHVALFGAGWIPAVAERMDELGW